jgi:hypothetical protein
VVVLNIINLKMEVVLEAKLVVQAAGVVAVEAVLPQAL